MKRALLLTVLALGGMVLITGLAGGVHYSRFTRYVPTSQVAQRTGEEYVPRLRPSFSRMSSPLHETLIPYLLYRHSEPDHSPRIYLEIERAGEPGFRGDSVLTIESLSARNESGTEFRLIVPSSPRSVSLPRQYTWTQENLGAVSGDSIVIQAEGYILTETGVKRPFSHEQSWRYSPSTRIDLGIMISE